MARPSKYRDELARKICAALAEGQPLTKICRKAGMPSYATVMKWRAENPAFSDMYMRAREDQADTLADEITDIADGASGKSAAEVNAARLRVDARKWVASKLKPRVYGDKLDVKVDPESKLTVATDDTLTKMIADGLSELAKLEGKTPEEVLKDVSAT